MKDDDMMMGKVLLVLILVLTLVTLVVLYKHDKREVAQPPNVEAASSDVFDPNSGQKVGQLDTTGTNCKEVGNGNVVCPGHPQANVQVCVADATASCAGDTACVISQADSCLAALGTVDLASNSASSNACGVLENLHATQFNCCSTTGNVCGGIETAYESAGCGVLTCGPPPAAKIVFNTAGNLLKLYDLATSTTVTIGKAGSTTSDQVDMYEIDNGIVGFDRRERIENTDFNGDGDKNDNILHYYTASSGLTTNTFVETEQGFFQKSISGNIIAFVRGQAPEPLEFYDITSTVVTNTGVSAQSIDIDGNLSAFHTDGNFLAYYDILAASFTNTGVRGINPRISGNIIANGGSGSILSYYDISSNSQTRIGGPENSNRPVDVDGNLVVFKTRELVLGEDLNGDNDTDDLVLRYHDISTGITFNTGIAGVRLFTIDGGLIAFDISEAKIGRFGQDLNGDGDTTDTVIQVYDTATGRTYNTGEVGDKPKIDA